MNTFSKTQQSRNAENEADLRQKLKQYRRHYQHRGAHKTSPWNMLGYTAGILFLTFTT